jgi:hypothetical protein
MSRTSRGMVYLTSEIGSRSLNSRRLLPISAGLAVFLLVL